MKFQFYRIHTKKNQKASKNKSPIFKPVPLVFKNASKPKWLEESRAGKIKEKAKTVVKKK